MAITIEQQPSSTLYVPVNNPIEYLVSSTNTSEPNFKLSCKVIVGSTEIKELMYDVIPSTAYVIAEVQKLLHSGYANLDSVLLAQTTGAVSLSPMNENAPNTNLVFQEFYSSSVTAEPTYQGTQASGTNIYVWNSAFKYREWVANDWHDYTIIQDGVNEKRNAKAKTSFTNYVENATFSDTSSSQYPINLSKNLRFKKTTPEEFLSISYQIRGTATNQFIHSWYFYDNNLAPRTTTPQYVRSINNAANLRASFMQTFSIGLLGTSSFSLWNQAHLTTAFTKETVKYVTFCMVKATDTAGVWKPSTVVYLYEIDWDACSKYDSYEIHWLNHLGGWDSWVFNKRSSIDIITEREFYIQPNQRRIVSDTIVHDQYARKKTQFYTSRSERYTVNSDILKDWEYDGLVDLLQSPQVYWRHPDYGFIAINILDQDVTRVPRQQDDKTYNLSFVFEIQNFDKLQSF